MRRALRALALGIATMTVGGLASCSGGGEASRPKAPPGEGATLLLAIDVPFAEITLPPDARGDLGAPPTRIPLRHFEAKGSEGGAAVTDLPIRTRNLYFFKPSTGMRVVKADGTEVPHKYVNPPPPYWTYDESQIKIHRWEGVPSDEELFLEYPPATAAEARMNLVHSGITDPGEFARTSAQAGPSSRTGLLLPAPAKAAWDIEVPPAPDLRFAYALVQPEVADGPPSDGATIRAVVRTADGAEHEVWSSAVKSDTFTPINVDLSAWEGQSVRFSLETDPGASNRFDYVFLADPVITSRKANPRRVFMVFVDTLRPDHVGAFGYQRDTTPALDDVASGAARFTNARSIAPWTLPSARTVLTGQDPEYYFDSPTLQGLLGRAGYATAMFAGNVYLTSNFGLNRDWGLHYVELLPRAKPQVDRALDWLAENDGRDVLMLLHFMDAHLPYKEPDEYRRMFAGDPPAGLPRDEFHRDGVVNAKLKTKEERQYVRDRYDNNIRYADDQLKRLYDQLRPDDVLVFFSDHGEEFWDHGGYEHGHSLFDELLRVPLIIRGGGLPAAAVDAPVSLLDVTPTILDLVGLPQEGMKGTSLVAAAKGDAAAKAALVERAQAFGRPLYGGERWGVLDGTLKYTTYEGRELLFDLASDAEERKDQLKGNSAGAVPMRAAMGEALKREVVTALRVACRGARKFPEHDLVATLTVPGGIRAAWVGDDPTESSMATLAFTEGSDQAVITWPTGYRGSRDVWVVPTKPLAETSHRVTLTAVEGEVRATAVIEADKPVEPTGDRVMLATTKVGDRSVELGFGVVPIPDPAARQLSGFDPELALQLEAMGYAVGAGEEKTPPKPKPAPKAE